MKEIRCIFLFLFSMEAEDTAKSQNDKNVFMNTPEF